MTILRPLRCFLLEVQAYIARTELASRGARSNHRRAEAGVPLSGKESRARCKLAAHLERNCGNDRAATPHSDRAGSRRGCRPHPLTVDAVVIPYNQAPDPRGAPWAKPGCFALDSAQTARVADTIGLQQEEEAGAEEAFSDLGASRQLRIPRLVCGPRLGGARSWPKRRG